MKARSQTTNPLFNGSIHSGAGHPAPESGSPGREASTAQPRKEEPVTRTRRFYLILPLAAAIAIVTPWTTPDRPRRPAHRRILPRLRPPVTARRTPRSDLRPLTSRPVPLVLRYRRTERSTAVACLTPPSAQALSLTISGRNMCYTHASPQSFGHRPLQPGNLRLVATRTYPPPDKERTRP